MEVNERASSSSVNSKSQFPKFLLVNLLQTPRQPFCTLTMFKIMFHRSSRRFRAHFNFHSFNYVFFLCCFPWHRTAESARLLKTMEKLLICYASSDFIFIAFSIKRKDMPCVFSLRLNIVMYTTFRVFYFVRKLYRKADEHDYGEPSPRQPMTPCNMSKRYI